MDLGAQWSKFSTQAKTAWNDYRNPTMNDEQLYGLMPKYSFDEGYNPTAGGLSNTMNSFENPSSMTGFTDFGQANPAQAMWTKFQDSPFLAQAQAVAGVANAGVNAFSAYNNTKMAKKQFAFEQNAWQKNYDAQKSTTNASLSDRQNSRVASNPNAYQSVDSYMNKYGIK